MSRYFFNISDIKYNLYKSLLRLQCLLEFHICTEVFACHDFWVRPLLPPQLILRYASEIIEKNSIYQINQYCKLKKSSIKYHSNRHLNISVKKYIHVHEYLKFQCKGRAHFSFGTCISNKEVVSVLAGFRQTKVITSLRVH